MIPGSASTPSSRAVGIEGERELGTEDDDVPPTPDTVPYPPGPGLGKTEDVDVPPTPDTVPYPPGPG